MEEYVWISKVKNIGIFRKDVHPILARIGREWNVEVTIAGSVDVEDGPFIQAIYDAIDRKVAGIMLHGWGVKEEITAINTAIEKGIPVVTVDSDVPNSKRLAHVGTDWFRMGSAMADQLVGLTGENGKLLFMGNIYLANVQTGFRGFQYRMNAYPNVELFGPEDASGIGEEITLRMSKAQAVTLEWLERHPDIGGIAGFDVGSGPGIAKALEKNGLAGKVKVVCVDTEERHLKYIRQGTIQAAFSQRRELFTYQAFQLLYSFNHGSASTGYQPGPINISGNIDTGFIIVTKGNADSFRDEFSLDEVFERQALTRRLALMSTMVESSGQIILAADIDRRVVYANPASFRHTGITGEQMIGAPIDTIFDFTEENLALIDHGITTETLVTLETTVRHEHGTTIPVQLTLSPMRSGSEGRGLTLIATDITDRKRAEEALRQNEEYAHELQERLWALHDIGLELSAIHDLDRFYYHAVLATKRLGIERCGLFLIDDDQNLVGTYGTDEAGNIRDEHFFKLPVSEDSRVMQLMNKAVRAYCWDDVELRGADQIVGRGWNVHALVWDGTKAIGFIALDSYLTHQPPRPYTVELAGLYANLLGNLLTQKRAELAIRQLNEELEQRVLARTKALEDANTELRQFAYILSHDLRAPLLNLKGFVSELRSSLRVVMEGCDSVLALVDQTTRHKMQDALQTDIPEALRFIESSADSMDHLAKSILRLSRLGRLMLEPVEVDTRAMIEKILHALAYQINQRGIKVTVGDLPAVTADFVSMEQIFGNILTNAVNYLDPNRPGEIDISAEQTEGETIFHIRDNGLGIAKEDMDKVFAPFRRAGKHSTPGEGMGLAYVLTLVRRHDGRIWYESEVGAGTTFSFTIPHHLPLDTLDI